MLVVKVELHSAITGETTEIARMIIHNEGGTKSSGDYGVRCFWWLRCLLVMDWK